MFPRFDLKIGDRVVISSGDVESEVTEGVLTFKLKDSDVVPHAVNSELVSIGGWRINAVSTIDSKAISNAVVESWKSLGEIVPIGRLLIPFLYSNAVDYARFQYSCAQPHWVDLLRLSYWHQKCLEIKDGNFPFKQTEIKRQILKPLRNTEKTLNAKGKGFPQAMDQLRRVVSSYSSELFMASISNRCGYKVSFHKNCDFLFEDFPCQVKSVYSHATIERQADGNVKMVVGGQVIGDKVNPFSELFNFLFSKKSLQHIHTAYKQSGKVIFLDITHTFVGLLLYLLSDTKDTDSSFCNALDNAVKLAKNSEEKLPVMIVCSVSSYEHQIPALVVPMPLQVFTILEKQKEQL